MIVTFLFPLVAFWLTVSGLLVRALIRKERREACTLMVFVGALIAATAMEMYRLATYSEWVSITPTPLQDFLLGFFTAGGVTLAVAALVVIVRGRIQRSRSRLGVAHGSQEKS